MSKILYLDQFIVSHLADETDDLYLKIKKIIIELFERGKLVCPLSPEHYFESSQRNLEDARRNDSFLSSISGGKCFLHTIYVHINLLKAVGNEVDFCIEDFIGDAHPNKFRDKEFLSDAKLKSELVRSEGDKSLRYLNSIRKLTKDDRVKNYVKSSEYLNMKRLMYLQFKYKIGKAVSDGFIRIGSEQLGDIELPDWKDQILEWLFRIEDIDRDGKKRIFNEILRNEFENIPSLYIINCLRSLQAVMHKQINFGDEIDNDRIAKALYPCDILVVDSKRKSEILALGFDKKYDSIVFSGKKKDMADFYDHLNKLM